MSWYRIQIYNNNLSFKEEIEINHEWSIGYLKTFVKKNKNVSFAEIYNDKNQHVFTYWYDGNHYYHFYTKAGKQSYEKTHKGEIYIYDHDTYIEYINKKKIEHKKKKLDKILNSKEK